jgi:transposase
VRAGRQRNVERQVDRILAGPRAEQFTQPTLVEQAMGRQALAQLRALNAAVANIADLEQSLGEAFAQHPDAAILTSFPGLGTVLGARILGEMGDDRTRFTDAKALKAFAGTAPVTRASGMKRSVTMRVVRNRRLCQAGYLWALPLLTNSPGARAHYDRRRETGDTYSAGRATPGQPLLRHLVPLPAAPNHLRRSQGLPTHHQDRRLTTCAHAMSVRRGHDPSRICPLPFTQVGADH